MEPWDPLSTRNDRVCVCVCVCGGGGGGGGGGGVYVWAKIGVKKRPFPWLSEKEGGGGAKFYVFLQHLYIFFTLPWKRGVKAAESTYQKPLHDIFLLHFRGQSYPSSTYSGWQRVDWQ